MHFGTDCSLIAVFQDVAVLISHRNLEHNDVIQTRDGRIVFGSIVIL